MVDEQWYIVADFKLWDFVDNFRNGEVFKNQYMSSFILSIRPVLLKGPDIYSGEISEIFWDVKIENGALKNTKTLDTKQARIL